MKAQEIRPVCNLRTALRDCPLVKAIDEPESGRWVVRLRGSGAGARAAIAAQDGRVIGLARVPCSPEVVAELARHLSGQARALGPIAIEADLSTGGISIRLDGASDVFEVEVFLSFVAAAASAASLLRDPAVQAAYLAVHRKEVGR
ncbi:MAG: hypothetical protein H5T86_03105 [Armatimonadetes bacterium]|nr:hypothetical protein [Armatimonadota bacterium]